ncbi:MAG: methenyltetrahydromethanopterin cyclohydrolase [Pirellulales bacterium]|nr:methenyltetrahydromethanopterin cyclohydrolase [Pirellulales bacterium]
MKLNERASRLCERIVQELELLRITVHQHASGSRVLDFGVDARGGLEAGRRLAEVCLAGLGKVDFFAGEGSGRTPAVSVRTDYPVAACMASQYAGWQITHEGYFAMGSGPMRAAAAREPLFETIGCRESDSVAVGVLETSQLPSQAVCEEIARKCRVEPEKLTLLVARTASQAGTVQVVARCVETAMHKLFELGFDLNLVESGFGVAPLPPVAGNDLTAMGWTNDAILYGGEVTLWVHGDESELRRLGPSVPSTSSRDHGRPFARIFEHYGRDFYAIDPLLFGPAVVTLLHLDTGRRFRFGRTAPDLLRESFGAGTT